MTVALALLLLATLDPIRDIETVDGRFVAHIERAPGFEDVREESALWQVDLHERLGYAGERLLWSQRLTTDQLGDRRLLAPDGSALVTIRPEVFGARPLVRIYGHGDDPAGLDEGDLGLERREFRKVEGRRRWLVDSEAASWIGWRDAVGRPQLVLELECVDGRLFVIDLATGTFAEQPTERVVTIEPGTTPTQYERQSARVTGFCVTPVVLDGGALQVDVNARRTAPNEHFAGFDLEFRGADELVLIPRLERTPSRPSVYGVVHHDLHFEAVAWITGLEPGRWRVSVEGSNGALDPAHVDVLAPGIVATLNTRSSGGRAIASVSLFEGSVARLRSSCGEVSFVHVPKERSETARRILGRLPLYGYERTSRRNDDGVTYEIVWWPRGERRTVVVDRRSARGRIEQLLDLLLALG